MQGGLGITYFQDTAKDMQMENCSSKSIRTRPDPHPCLNHPHPPPPGRGGGDISHLRMCRVAMGTQQMEKQTNK